MVFTTCRDLWREMVERRGIQPTEITLSCMIDAIVCAGQVKEAIRLFRLWESQVPANTVIYSTLIKGFANNGDADGAMALYKELQAKGVEMNLVAWLKYAEGSNVVAVPSDGIGSAPTVHIGFIFWRLIATSYLSPAMSPADMVVFLPSAS